MKMVGPTSVSRAVIPFAIEHNLGAVLPAQGDIPFDPVELVLGDQGTHPCRWLHRITHGHVGCCLDEPLDKLVMDTPLDQQSRPGVADLAAEEAERLHGRGRRLIEIGILKDDVRDLPPVSRIKLAKLFPTDSTILRPVSVDPVNETFFTSW